MMAHRVLCSLGIAAMLFSAPYAWSVDVLSARELVAHCAAFPDAADTPDGLYCIRYIQGFIDGAVATDARVMMNLEAEEAGDESFTERAVRTRAPDREAQKRASVYAEYCLGDLVSLQDVIEKVVLDLSQRKHLEPELTAREAVYVSLRHRYPCEQPQTEK